MSLCRWQKFLSWAKAIGEFITWKQVECPFGKQDLSITHYLHTAPIFSEDGKVLLASLPSASMKLWEAS